jgi:hypothetical protein
LHYYEAILATFAILIWHMYSVVFDPDIYPLDRVRLSKHTEPVASVAPLPATIPAAGPPGAATSASAADSDPPHDEEPPKGQPPS